MNISMDGITEDHASLRIISPAYAGRTSELTAILQYVYQSVILAEHDRVEESKILSRISKDEMHHLQILGTLITKLGAPPTFTSCPPYPVGFYSANAVNYSREIKKMITADICGEREAIAQYRQMIERLNNRQVIAVIEHIIGEEEEHLALLDGIAAAL